MLVGTLKPDSLGFGLGLGLGFGMSPFFNLFFGLNARKKGGRCAPIIIMRRKQSRVLVKRIRKGGGKGEERGRKGGGKGEERGGGVGWWISCELGMVSVSRNSTMGG